jgi:hypothetical protein
MSKASFITAQLRESVPYLKDAGWHETAKLLLAAAAEIELLHGLLEQSPVGPSQQANENQTSQDARIA